MKEAFSLQQPGLMAGPDIERESLARVQRECEQHQRFHSFNAGEREVIKRLIHTSTCFQQVIDGIYFTERAIEKTAALLQSGCIILSDTNMIQAGLSAPLMNKWGNRALCHVSRPDVVEDAARLGVTRSHLAVSRALLENRDAHTLLACGNAPTFLYSAIETFVQNGLNPDNLAVIAFPVGFVNVIESKEYAKSFLSHFGIEGMILEGPFGSSPMVVSAIHAVYRLI